MRQRIFNLLLFLLFSVGLHSALLPGDFALTRISKEEVVLVALKDIGTNEQIKVTDSFWIHGAFDDSGNESTITLTQPLLSGQQLLIDLESRGIYLDWDKTLHFYQDSTLPNSSSQRHLFMVEVNRDGLRWFETPPGLEPDLTHIVIPELQFFEGEIDHIINNEVAGEALTPFQWLRALGSFRAWTPFELFTGGTLPLFVNSSLTVKSSGGMITFPAASYHLNEQDGKVFVPVRRQYGSEGSISVDISSSNRIEPLGDWENLSSDGFYADLTDLAYAPFLNYAIAVSPNSGTLLRGTQAGWVPTDTNNDPLVNLKLSGITHDGYNFWACSIDGTIHSSTDGINWSLSYSPSSGATPLYRILSLESAAIAGEPSLIALGENGLILYYDAFDGWQISPSGVVSKTLFSIDFDGSNFVAVGQGGTIISTQDLTQTWQVVSSPTNRTLYSIVYSGVSSNAGFYAVGRQGTIVHSAAVSNGFVEVASSTKRHLYNVVNTPIETDSGTGQVSDFIIACGAGGTVIASKDGKPFRVRRSINRASALYAIQPIVLASSSGAAAALIAVGEYGAIVDMNTSEQILSGDPINIQLNDAVTTSLGWSSGENSEKFVEVAASSVNGFRERIDLVLEQPISANGSYRLGTARAEVNLMRSIGSNVYLTPNFGPQLYIKDSRIEINSEGEWEYKFKVGNSSNAASGRLFLRFEGTNLPDWEIPQALLPGGGNGTAPLAVSGDIVTTISQPVEAVRLYEEFRPGEYVPKYRQIINSLWSASDWLPNGIFPRSLGIYLEDDGSLENPGVPGLENIITNSGNFSLLSSGAFQDESDFFFVAMGLSGGGSVFSDGVPTQPVNAPGDPELVLTGTDVMGPTGMDVRSTYSFFLEGDFYNTSTGLIEIYSMNTVDWDVTESGFPAVGLSINSDGDFEASAYPSVSYPRSTSIDSITTEGAPLDEHDDPIEYPDSHALSITRPSSDLDFDEWITAETTLTGDDALSTANPDDDGNVNFLEFAFDLDPESHDLNLGFTHIHDSDLSESTFSLTIPLDRDEIIYTVQTTTDLSADPVVWTDQELTFASDDGSTETWETSVSSGDALFGRVSVEENVP